MSRAPESASQPMPPRRGFSRLLPVLILGGLGTTASLILFSNLRERERESIAMDVERGVHGLVTFSQSEIVVGFTRAIEARLRRLAEDFQGRESITQEALDEHRWPIRWSQAPAFFVNLEYLPRVREAERTEFERASLSGREGTGRIVEETGDGRLRPAASRTDHFPVLFETSAAETRAVPGVDRAGTALSRLTLERSRDSGAVATYGHVPTAAEGAGYDMSFRSYFPIYEGGQTPSGVAERRERLTGFVSVVTYASLAEIGLQLAGVTGIEVAYFFDQGELKAEELEPALARGLRHSEAMQLTYESGGDDVRVVGAATPGLVRARRHGQTWMALVLGLLTTGFASSLLLRAGRRSDEVVRLVQERTRELNERTRALSAANQRLIDENEERQRAEKALRESETRYRLLAQNVSDVIYTHDLDFRCTYISPSVTRQRGFEVDEVLGQDILGNLTPESADFAKKQLDYVLRAIEQRPELARGHRTTQFEAVCKDGSTITLENRTSLLFDDDGEIMGVLGVSRDISDRRQVEKEKEELESRYRHAQKMEAIGTLAGGVAHDFNNLLTGILGYTDVLQLELEPGSRSAQSVAVIERAAVRAQELTSQLLGFARRGKFQSLPVDLDEAIGDVISFLERTLHKNIRIERRRSSETPWVLGDPSQIHQLLLNLAVNAKDAMPEGGKLTFSTEIVDLDEDGVRSHVGLTPGRYNLVTVSDTGTGIPADKLERIFEPFFTDKEGGSGTGMGLAMVYGVSKSHQGSVGVRSEEGRGSTFEVYLPFSPGPAKRAARAPRELVCGTGTLLVVDDEEIIRELARELLAQLGYRVIAAEDGPRALEIFRERRGEIDLVLIDVMMPGMGGRECFERLREIDPDVKVIFATAYSSEELEDKVGDGTGAGFLQKPYRLQQLSESVAELLGSVPSA